MRNVITESVGPW